MPYIMTLQHYEIILGAQQLMKCPPATVHTNNTSGNNSFLCVISEETNLYVIILHASTNAELDLWVTKVKRLEEE